MSVERKVDRLPLGRGAILRKEGVCLCGEGFYHVEGRGLACVGQGDGCAKGRIYSVPKKGVLLFFRHGDSRGGEMPSTLDWEGKLLRVDIRI